MLSFVRLVYVGDVRPLRIDTGVVAVMMQGGADLVPYQYEHQHPTHEPECAACGCSLGWLECRALHTCWSQRYLVMALNSEI